MIKNWDLDLRNETDRARSQLLHRAAPARYRVGRAAARRRQQVGTFHEYWQAPVAGRVCRRSSRPTSGAIPPRPPHRRSSAHLADKAEDLPQLTELLERVILAELPEAVEHLLRVQIQRAAVSADVRHLMDALPALAQVARYGDVRGTEAERMLPVIEESL